VLRVLLHHGPKQALRFIQPPELPQIVGPFQLHANLGGVYSGGRFEMGERGGAITALSRRKTQADQCVELLRLGAWNSHSPGVCFVRLRFASQRIGEMVGDSLISFVHQSVRMVAVNRGLELLSERPPFGALPVHATTYEIEWARF
jgi:hypothetical protein